MCVYSLYVAYNKSCVTGYHWSQLRLPSVQENVPANSSAEQELVASPYGQLLTEPTSVKPFQHSYTINQLTNKPTILEFNSFYQENTISNLHLQKQGTVKTPRLVIAPYDQSSKLWTSEFPSRHQVRIAPSRQFSPTSTCLQRRRGRGEISDGNRMQANL